MVLNYIKRLLAGQLIEKEDYADITSQIQKQILKKRYIEGKQNKLYENQPKFSRSVVRYTNSTNKYIKNVILFKKKKLEKLN
jgi:hypothetical protein|tara:strand:+ start:1509 stop:1754 length:246 start_codon:yes stop_codon:yes gene_type:complete